MKVRLIKNRSVVGKSSSFNPHSLNEILVYFEDGTIDSDYLSEYEVYCEVDPYRQVWIPLTDAFRLKQVIPNRERTRFREVRTTIEKGQGYY